MLENLLFLKNSTGNSRTQQKSLYKYEPITIHLTPSIVLAGVVIMLILLGIGIGCNESYNFLLSGV